MDNIQELEKFWKQRGFSRVRHTGRILWLRDDESEVSLVDIVPERLPGQPERNFEELEDEMQQIERKLMIQTNKRVNRLTLLMCDDLPGKDELKGTENAPDIWWLDYKHGRILVFEKQRTDFLGYRGELENYLVRCLESRQEEHSREIRRMFQPVTVTIVTANVLFFIILSLMGDTEDSQFMSRMGVMSWEAVMAKKEYYRLLTAMFMHFGLQHLIQNMLILMLVGTRLERVVGKIRYIFIYLGAGLSASLSSVFFTLRGTMDIAAGASGAIFGIMGGLVCLLLQDTFGKRRHYMREIGLAGVIFMVVCAASYGFFETGVDNAAHIGGLLGGILLTAILTVFEQKT